MKARYQFYTMDWAPNGTQPLIVSKNGKQIDCKDEVLFGIDVNKLGSARYLDPNFPDAYFRVSEKLIKKHVAQGPFGYGFEANCLWLQKYLGRGAK